MKKCSKCGEEKESTDFYSDKLGKDGLRSECKRCHIKAVSSYNKTGVGKKGQAEYWRSERGKKAHVKKQAKYQKTKKGKITDAKRQAKRKRDLGFILINSWFPACNFHHLNETYVLAIPVSLHRRYPHNHKDLDSMQEINSASIKWFYSLT